MNGSLTMTFAMLAFLVALALVFDFMNGFHDAANSIATVVSTGVLKPYQAVVWAATFNILAYLLFELKVAATVGKGIVDPSVVDHYVIFGALVGAIAWNVVTWWFGIPSSSSHALIGGMMGATIAKAGLDALIGSGIAKVAAFILVSPMLGFVLGSALAGLGGVLWGFYQQSVTAQMGSQVNVLIFIVIIIGGLGSILGCFVGALLVGLVANYAGFLEPKIALFSNIALMVAILLWRPQGLYPVSNR